MVEWEDSAYIQLQELIRGKSAFEVWKAQQTPKQEGEADYTYADFINAIKGAKGDKGDNGNDGLSAYEVWLSQQSEGEYSYEDYLEAIQGPAGPDGKDADGKSWWEYLIDYGITGASAAGTIASVVSVQD